VEDVWGLESRPFPLQSFELDSVVGDEGSLSRQRKGEIQRL
jgi:hypothetical protein